jgi:hypothetical protein
MIDFKKLEMADIEIVSGPANPALDRAFSEFLKARNAMQASRAIPRSKKASPIPSARTSKTKSISR